MDNGSFYDSQSFLQNPLSFATHIDDGGQVYDRQTGFYNARYKYVFGVDGSAYCVEELYSSVPVFNGDHLTPLKNSAGGVHKKNKSSDPASVEAAKRRAIKKIKDYILANRFEWFITLTFDGGKIDRTSYADCISKFNTFCDNCVRRRAWAYVGVIEPHKRGGLHFHLLLQAQDVPVVHSGTYIHPSFGRPVKRVTLDRKGIDISACRDVYNLTNWKWGFTTAIQTYGDRMAIARYIGKYITKSSEKIGGRWYYSGGDLRSPIYRYDRVDFDSVKNASEFETDGGAFKIIYHDEVIK